MEPTGATLDSVHTSLWPRLPPRDVERLRRRGDEADVEALGRVVGQPQAQRWVWQAIAHRTGAVWASIWGRRQEAGGLPVKARREPVRSTRVHPDDGGADGRHRDPAAYPPGQRNPQTIARKPLT
jgi:insertion element IS1 protein InsB